MLDNVIAWLSGRQTRAPSLPAGATARVPAQEPVVAPEFAPHQLADDLVGTSWFIVYRDSKGEESQRRITVMGFKEGSSGRSVMAMCHERKAWRQFIVSRIDAVTDIETSELIEPPSRVFGAAGAPAAKAPPRPEAQAHARFMTEARDGLRVLILLARSDGRMCAAEEDILIGFAEETAAAHGLDYDRAKLIAWARKQTPDAALGATSLRRMAERHSDLALPGLAKHMAEMISADRVVTSEEAALLRKMRGEIAAIQARWGS